MQQATPETVLGDFNNAILHHHSVTTRFSRRDDKFVVLTDGPDGKPAEFDVKYVLASRSSDAGDVAGAEGYVRELAAIKPGDPALQRASRT